MAEPITAGAVAGWVALKLLEGALNYIGGKLAASALGEPDIKDVRTWIREAVAELESFVSAELKRQLDAKVMEELRADLQGVIENVHHYASLSEESHAQNRYLLETSDTDSARAIPRCLEYDQALFVTTTLMAYRLWVLFALYDLDKDPGHIKSARDLVDQFVTRASIIRDEIGIAMSPETHFRINCGIMGETVYYCAGIRDGVRITPFYKAPEKINGRDSHDVMREQISKQLAPLTAPMQQQMEEFLHVATGSIARVIECYDEMCRKIGEVYQPTTTTALTPKAAPIKWPDAVVMPGAIVTRPEWD